MRYGLPGETGGHRSGGIWPGGAHWRAAAVPRRQMAVRPWADCSRRDHYPVVRRERMKIVIWRSPKCLCGVFRKLFGMGKD